MWSIHIVFVSALLLSVGGIVGLGWSPADVVKGWLLPAAVVVPIVILLDLFSVIPKIKRLGTRLFGPNKKEGWTNTPSKNTPPCIYVGGIVLLSWVQKTAGVSTGCLICWIDWLTITLSPFAPSSRLIRCWRKSRRLRWWTWGPLLSLPFQQWLV